MMTVAIMVDSWGQYDPSPWPIFRDAPKRKDGWWDRRTKLGRAAIRQFEENEAQRAAMSYEDICNDARIS